MLVRFALDDEVGFALQQVSHFDTRMGMTSGTAARRNFGDPGHGIVAVRKLGLLQRRALDAAALLGKGDTCTGKGDDGHAEQNFLDHDVSPCGRRLAAPGAVSYTHLTLPTIYSV